jgi:hypothetical protein
VAILATLPAESSAQIMTRMPDDNDFAAVGEALLTAHRAFDTAQGKLATGKGNLVNRAQKLIRLGAPAKDETRAALAAAGDDEEDVPAEPGAAPALPQLPGDHSR